jgi:hypothetical protein
LLNNYLDKIVINKNFKNFKHKKKYRRLKYKYTIKTFTTKNIIKFNNVLFKNILIKNKKSNSIINYLPKKEFCIKVKVIKKYKFFYIKKKNSKYKTMSIYLKNYIFKKLIIKSISLPNFIFKKNTLSNLLKGKEIKYIKILKNKNIKKTPLVTAFQYITKNFNTFYKYTYLRFNVVLNVKRRKYRTRRTKFFN